MVVRISCMHSDAFDVEYYEEDERIRIDSNAISANFMILEDEDQNEALDGREGELSKSFDYELHDEQLCAIVDCEFMPGEDDVVIKSFLHKRDGEEV